MPVQKTHHDQKLTIYTIENEAEFEEIKATLEAFYSERPTLNVIWDIRQGTVKELSYDNALALSQFTVKVSGRRLRGKTAIVSAKAVDYGIGRMFEAIAENQDAVYSIKSFYDFDEALAWINEVEF